MLQCCISLRSKGNALYPVLSSYCDYTVNVHDVGDHSMCRTMQNQRTVKEVQSAWRVVTV